MKARPSDEVNIVSVVVPPGAEIPFGRTDGGWLLRLPQGLVPDPAADAFELFFD